jgi:hypothetical protein
LQNHIALLLGNRLHFAVFFISTICPSSMQAVGGGRMSDTQEVSTMTEDPNIQVEASDVVDEPSEEAETRDKIRRANAEAAKYRVERNEARQRIQDLEARLGQVEEELTGRYEQTVESMRQEVTEALTEANHERLARLRMAAVVEHGLPPELADRLSGDDAETLQADAARLATLFPVRKSVRTGNAAQPHAQTRARQIFNRIGGGDQNTFDVLLQQRLGGGAVVGEE